MDKKGLMTYAGSYTQKHFKHILRDNIESFGNVLDPSIVSLIRNFLSLGYIEHDDIQ